MINGLGVLGWGVGGIEAEAAMLGQPMSMLIPQVVGFKLDGELPEGATATDLVLTVTQMLREHGVVGKFVEFYGPGVPNLPLADRATIGNMSPEFGSTCAIFPIDAETLRYLEFTGPPAGADRARRGLRAEQGLWHDADSEEPTYTETLELDLGDVVPSLAGPKRPQDRVALTESKASFRMALDDLVPDDSPRAEATRTSEETFPASDPPATNGDGSNGHPEPAGAGARPRRRRSPTARSSRSPVTLADGTETELDHGPVVIAAITCCTNTSNPSVMVGAGLLASKAVERGLRGKPWVKTSLAPGSKVVTDYFEKAGLVEPLEALGFNLVGYGCTTCIGNSGPLPQEISEAVNDDRPAVVSVLTGNRNFEGRINPDVKMNYLASPPLVVAYALAGTMDIDLLDEPLGTDKDGKTSTSRTSGRPRRRSPDRRGRRAVATCSRSSYGEVFEGDERWNSLDGARGRPLRLGRRLDLRRAAAVLRGPAARARAGRRHRGRARAGHARRLGHDRPHLARGRDQEGLAGGEVPERARRGAQGLQLLRLPPRQPRGDDARHVREHPPAQPARAGTRGPRRRPARSTTGEVMPIYDAAMQYAERGHAARRARRQGVRLRLLARLGREGHDAARRARGDRRELRAHPPLEPRRHGRAAAAVPRRRERRLARAHRRGGVHDHRRRRAAARRRSPSARATPSSPRGCASTPRRRSSTTSTAGSCRSCCAQLLDRGADEGVTGG